MRARRFPPSASAPARRRPRRGFSLLEVVAAVAIFAVGMIGVLALFAPVTKSVASVSEAEAAARIAGAVRARLQAMPFADAAALLADAAIVRKNDADPAYNPNDGAKHPTVLFGKLNGEIGLYDAAAKTWLDTDFSKAPPVTKPFSDAEKFFELDLIRNDTLSPADADATAPLLAYTLRVRWPAFVATSSSTGVQSAQAPAGSAVAFDHSKKQVLFFTGFVTR
jgi:prepilin-type N-terminal cleavage/methylation domain-containing protein